MATGIQIGALTAICASYAGYLVAPMGIALRLLLGAAGLFAAFYHGVPDLLRLVVAVGVPAGLAFAAIRLWRPNRCGRDNRRMRMLKHMMLALALLAPGLAAAQQPANTGPTLQAIRARGAVSCGISTGDPAWSQPDSRGIWQGMDADTAAPSPPRCSAARTSWSGST